MPKKVGFALIGFAALSTLKHDDTRRNENIEEEERILRVGVWSLGPRVRVRGRMTNPLSPK